ncbi:uncharacterized protein LOC127850185 isoform X2 [Dreissena polymorpha]|uniref:uncharacterized protein LOC127850185 isoform X2 n=1 Tax=Dreissena polymorpha TaxID=45954 RepID=UPI0022650B7A|nr:uncharacterized protein LOC127850185 isoform X2 [Dreissena polymorpha]
MGHGGDFNTMTTSVSRASVTRHPTVPMSRPESVTSPLRKLSFFSPGSSGTNGTVHHKTGDNVTQVNTHSQMIAGKKRSPKELKRRNSYRLALNRQSAADELDKDGNARHSKTDLDLETSKCSDVTISRGDCRKKYNTLPIKPGSLSNDPVVANSSDVLSEKLDNKSRTFNRNWSQKSGSYPSPDTDEDRGLMASPRKKKSRFRRFKERLIESFRRDRDHVNDFEKSQNGAPHIIHKGHTHKVKPSHPVASSAYNTPDDENAVAYVGHGDNRARLSNAAPEMEISSGGPSGDSGAKGDKSPSLFKRFRNSFRTSKKKPNVQQDIKFVLTEIQEVCPATPSTEDLPQKDDITDLFQEIIECVPTRKPDRSKLRLEGLVTAKPVSFDLSPDVETDGGRGHDVTDGPTLPTIGLDEDVEDESDGGIADQKDNQRACNDIADRLKAIGDYIVNKKLSESESEAGSFRTRRRPSSLELDIIRQLREVADTHPVFKSERAQPSVQLLPLIAPAIKSLLKAPTYEEFKQAVSRELADTVGWEQVAWYTYLVQTSMLAVKGGISAGQSLKNYATRYFRSNIRPWILDRPNGWESIYEETDVDTELD